MSGVFFAGEVARRRYFFVIHRRSQVVREPGGLTAVCGHFVKQDAVETADQFDTVHSASRAAQKSAAPDGAGALWRSAAVDLIVASFRRTGTYAQSGAIVSRGNRIPAGPDPRAAVH